MGEWCGVLCMQTSGNNFIYAEQKRDMISVLSLLKGHKSVQQLSNCSDCASTVDVPRPPPVIMI